MTNFWNCYTGWGHKKWLSCWLQSRLDVHPKSISRSCLTQGALILFMFLSFLPHDSLVNPNWWGQRSSSLSLVIGLGQACDSAAHWGVRDLEVSGKGLRAINKAKPKKWWPLWFVACCLVWMWHLELRQPSCGHEGNQPKDTPEPWWQSGKMETHRA